MILEMTPPERHPKIKQAAVRLEKAFSGRDVVKHSSSALSIPRSRAGMELREMKEGAGKKHQKGHKNPPSVSFAPNS